VDELVDYYNEQGEVIGFCSRDEADTKNYIYPNVLVFVFTGDKKVWIQKRSLSKRHYPGLWDPSACGALAHNEDARTAAERELLEEMGIACNLTFVEKFLQSFPGEDDQITRSRMSYLFIGISDKTPKGKDEVEAVAAFDSEDLLKEAKIRPEDFVPSFEVEFQKALKGYKSIPEPFK